MSQDRNTPKNAKPKLYSPASAFKRFKLNRKLSFLRFKDNSAKRAAVLNKNSARSNDKMAKLLSSITNTYSHMNTHSHKDEKIQSNMRNIALNQAKQLKLEVNKITKINNDLNAFYHENYTDTINNEIYPLTINDYILKDEDSASYDDISIVTYDDEKSKTMNKKVEEYLHKRDTLHKLKGEIILREQRLKYFMNEAFEKPKVLRKRDFIRSDFNASKYQPKLIYNKNNLVYKKQYTSKEKNNTQNKTIKLKSTTTNRPTSRLSSRSNFPNTIQSYTSSKPTSRNINSSSNSTQSSTFNKKCRMRIASPSSFNQILKTKSIDYDNNTNNTNTNINNDTLITYTLPNKPKTSKKLNLKEIYNKINSTHIKVFHNGNSLTNRIMNNLNSHKQKEKVKKKEQKDFDLNAIIKEFNLSLSPRFQPINENRLITSNAERVSKYLTKDARVILREVIKQLLRENHCVNSHMLSESLNDRQLRKIRQEKEFKKVCNQTMAIKKHFNIQNTIEPINEKEKIHKIMKKLNSTSWDDGDNLKFLVLKSKVMEHIKPLLVNKYNV